MTFKMDSQFTMVCPECKQINKTPYGFKKVICIKCGCILYDKEYIRYDKDGNPLVEED